MAQPPNKNLAYIHGEMVRSYMNPKEQSYLAFLKDVSPEGHGETYLKIIEDPEQPVYVTKPPLRLNTVKKELEDKKNLDMYRTKVSQIPETLWNAVNNPGRWRNPPFVQPKKMLSNPYIYGADIDYGVILKEAYNRANGGRKPLDYNVGFLDIETDVNGSEQIILITFMNGDGRTFVGILKEFFLDHTVDEVYKMWEKKVEPSFRSKLSKKGLEAYTKSGGIKIECKILPNEAELIRWTFSNIHACRPDFVGVWNIDFDVPYILQRCEFRQLDPKQIFCSPEVPYKYRICKYKPDPGKKDGHLVDRWPWLHLTAFERWIDMMMLYGRLRKAKPREPSYKLDAIGGKEIGAGKLEFGNGESHSTMQRFHQVEYTVYNIVDVLIMYVMEKKNNDVRNMMMLIGVSTLDCFAHQSIQLKNHFYQYLDKLGCVPASIGERIDDPWDYLIHNKGGAVLSPDNATIAVHVLIEDMVAIRGSRYVCDIDVSSTIPATR